MTLLVPFARDNHLPNRLAIAAGLWPSGSFARLSLSLSLPSTRLALIAVKCTLGIRVPLEAGAAHYFS